MCNTSNYYKCTVFNVRKSVPDNTNMRIFIKYFVSIDVMQANDKFKYLQNFKFLSSILSVVSCLTPENIILISSDKSIKLVAFPNVTFSSL